MNVLKHRATAESFLRHPQQDRAGTDSVAKHSKPTMYMYLCMDLSTIMI